MFGVPKDKKIRRRRPVATSTIENVKNLSLEFLQECFRYNAEEGFLYWHERPLHHFEGNSRRLQFNSMCAGNRAGTINNLGYVPITLTKGEISYRMFAHHIVWKLHGGEFVDGQVLDHINGIPWDNRIENLRQVPPAINVRNSRLRKDNKYGCPGIHWLKNKSQYRVEMVTDGVHQHIGYYDTLEEAVAARQEAELRIRGHLSRTEGWVSPAPRQTAEDYWGGCGQDAHLIGTW